jgi:O-antigen ligase
MSCLFAIAALLSLKNLEHFSSGRLHLWQLSLRGIAERFLWGWGFDGFGIAFPFVADWVGRHQGYLLEKVAVAHVLKLDDFTFDYQGIDGKLHAGILITNKAHNLLLDTTLSVGVLGLLCYALLWWFFLKCTVRTKLIGIEAVAIAYLIYTLSWYESAQFSHLAWWALSAGLGFPRVAAPSFLGRNGSNYEPDP